ncbi:MAG: GNAT family N-acetyltransferase [Chloroflexi bacterium]|nr:GNAT family N-acetyltransferase [Chloroflexota bacterium]
MIIRCGSRRISEIHSVINEAARAYDGVIPADCYHEPYMPIDEFRSELERVTFFGWEEDRRLKGVMGLEPVRDVTLIRHAYVLPGDQKRGIGYKLLDHLKSMTTTPRLLVGTWATALWAVRFYEKHGFRLMPDKDRLLQEYWDVPARQIETSVVLGFNLAGGEK